MSLPEYLALITVAVIVVGCVVWWPFHATAAKDDDQNQRTVACKNCRKTIVIASLTNVTEFSVKCDRCGRRSLYLPKEINVTGRK